MFYILRTKKTPVGAELGIFIENVMQSFDFCDYLMTADWCDVQKREKTCFKDFLVYSILELFKSSKIKNYQLFLSNLLF